MFIERFESEPGRPGPSLYFHNRAISVRRQHRSATSLLRDDTFIEYVYAVLPSWGMHRMGDQKAKVCEFEPFAEALRRHSPQLDELWDLRISELDPLRTQEVAESIWGIIADLQVSRSKTQIVAGSKTLHHVLPDLVPPIDRQYTFRFFTGRKYVRNDKVSFLEWYPHFVEIAHRARGQIIKAIERGGFMATGEAKVVDNAIIAFMTAHGGISGQ